LSQLALIAPPASAQSAASGPLVIFVGSSPAGPTSPAALSPSVPASTVAPLSSPTQAVSILTGAQPPPPPHPPPPPPRPLPPLPHPHALRPNRQAHRLARHQRPRARRRRHDRPRRRLNRDYPTAHHIHRPRNKIRFPNKIRHKPRRRVPVQIRRPAHLLQPP